MSDIKLFDLSAGQAIKLQGRSPDQEKPLQRLGVPHGGPARCGAYARQGLRRAGSRASVLSGDDAGDAEVDD